MLAVIKVTWTTHMPEALRALARFGKDATQNACLLMAASVPEGVGRAEAACKMIGELAALICFRAALRLTEAVRHAWDGCKRRARRA